MGSLRTGMWKRLLIALGALFVCSLIGSLGKSPQSLKPEKQEQPQVSQRDIANPQIEAKLPAAAAPNNSPALMATEAGNLSSSGYSYARETFHSIAGFADAFAKLGAPSGSPNPLTLQAKAQKEEQSAIAPLSYKKLLEQSKIKPAGLILQVNFEYDQDKAKHLSIQSMYTMNGYAPKFPDSPIQNPSFPKYTLQIKNSNGESLYTLPFQVHTILLKDEIKQGKLTGGQQISRKVDFTLVIPWVLSGSSLTISDSSNNQITQASLSESKTINNTPDFSAIIPPSDQSVSPDTTYLSITFIGDMYTEDQLPQFHTDVANFENHLITTYEPYKSRASGIRFYYVDNTVDLGCTYHDGVLFCDEATVIQQVGATPWDRIMVIVNNPVYGGGARWCGSIAVGYNGSWGPPVFAHELEHSLACLDDEYDYGVTMPFDYQTHSNCYAGPPPAASWQNIVSLNDYYTVCGQSNWARSSSTSLMKAIDSYFFNAVSQTLINNVLTSYMGPDIDTVTPTVSLSLPQSSMYVTGNVYFTATASDDNGVAWVELWQGADLQNTLYQTPYTWTWNAGSHAQGTYTFQAKAHDTAGNIGTSPITLIDCPGDASRDGIVNVRDFTILKSEYGFVCPPTYPCHADFNGDQVINVADFNIYKQNQGMSCIPATPTP